MKEYINIFLNIKNMLNPFTNKIIDPKGKTAQTILKKYLNKEIKLNLKTIRLLKGGYDSDITPTSLQMDGDGEISKIDDTYKGLKLFKYILLNIT